MVGEPLGCFSVFHALIFLTYTSVLTLKNMMPYLVLMFVLVCGNVQTLLTKKTERSSSYGTPAEFPFVVPFIFKRKFPPAPVASGVVITTKLVLSVAYPVAVMPLNNYCALAGFPHLGEVTQEEIERQCIGIKKAHLPDNWVPNVTALNIALVELEGKIIFNWYVSTSRIPFPDDPEKFTYNVACTLAGWKYRDAISSAGFPLKRVATDLVKHNILVDVTANHYSYARPDGFNTFYLCSANLGMPVICDCTIVGIIALFNLAGYMDCAEFPYMSYVNILHVDVQAFLKVSIPSSFNYTNDYGDNS